MGTHSRFERKEQMTEYDFQRLFSTFLNDEISLTGGGKTPVRKHIEDRMQTYNFYKHKFSPTQIQNLRREDFHYFLTPSGNQSWTNLQRKCKQAISDMQKLKTALLHLQKENILVEGRLNDVSRGGNFTSKALEKT